MKRLWLFVSRIVLPLSSCLVAEKFSLSLDFKGNTAEVGYLNIVSDSKEEDKIKDYFEELIKKAYGVREQDGHLDGVVRYSFKDDAEMLKEYEIKTDEKGDFIFDLSKESSRDLEYAGGNGSYTDEGKNRFVRWGGNSTSLKMKLKNKVFDSKNKSLLSYWLEWKEPNPK